MISESNAEPHHWAIFRETSETPGAMPFTELPLTSAATFAADPRAVAVEVEVLRRAEMSAATSASSNPKTNLQIDSPLTDTSFVVKSCTATTLFASSSCV